MEKKHILICGPRGVGKSTLIEKLLAQCTVPTGGFFTRATPRDARGFHSIYIHPAGTQSLTRSEDNYIGNCNGADRTVYPEVFTRLGVPMLQEKESRILFMDELGFMEVASDPFCRAVMACLDGDIPVIAAVKEYDIDFLNQIRSHPKAEVYRISKENRDALYQQLLPIIQCWNGCKKEHISQEES